MQFAGISLAVGIADMLDDDIDGLDGFVEVALCLMIVGLLLIGFARLDDFIMKRWSPVKRIIWLRRLGLRAWR
jgi:hypothetical protein